jgi:holliday junction DNA helicase RuvB
MKIIDEIISIKRCYYKKKWRFIMANQIYASDVSYTEKIELSDIIGQPQVKSVVDLNLDAYKSLKKALPAKPPQFGPGLLSGPSGTGKTMTGKSIHNAIGNTRILTVNGVTFSKKGEFYATMVDADDDTTIFIDEAQAIDKKTQHLLLTAISERKVDIPVGRNGEERYTLFLPNFALFLATTDEYCLIAALRNRMRFHCRFDYYQNQDLIEIVKRRADVLHWKYESEQVLEMIAKRAKGTPRIALETNLHHSWSQAVRNQRDIITVKDVHDAFEILQIDEEGLDHADRSYLDTLYHYGPLPLNVISSKLAKPEATISRILEPYLIKNAFIVKDKHSLRIITSKGKNHLENTNYKPSK